jgi:hypothetical protein
LKYNDIFFGGRLAGAASCKMDVKILKKSGTPRDPLIQSTPLVISTVRSSIDLQRFDRRFIEESGGCARCWSARGSLLGARFAQGTLCRSIDLIEA